MRAEGGSLLWPQSPVAFKRMPVVEVDDGGPLPVLEPVVARNLAVVLVDFAVAILPGVVLASTEFEPAKELLGGGLGARGPVADVIHDL
ncbi:MAG: hypothetical protein ACK5Q5_00380, partial [Planctomycetaceae bacterium]